MKRFWIMVWTIVMLAAIVPAYADDAAHTSQGGVSDNRTDAETAQILAQIEKLAEDVRRGSPRFSMVGELMTDNAGRYTINGDWFRVDQKTSIDGDLVIGSQIEVRGTISGGGEKIAQQIVVRGNGAVRGATAISRTLERSGDPRVVRRLR